VGGGKLRWRFGNFWRIGLFCGLIDEEAGLGILKVAEEKVKYLKTVHNGK
jgi:hypothetical protein